MSNAAYTDITIDEYREHYSTLKIVDVREVDEYEEGHLPGTVNIPLSELQDRWGEIPNDEPIVLVCRSGGRSARAAEFLAMHEGYAELYNLMGGTMGWIQRGFDIEE